MVHAVKTALSRSASRPLFHSTRLDLLFGLLYQPDRAGNRWRFSAPNNDCTDRNPRQ